MTSLLGARFGPYEVIEPIGAGGMGEVYRARDHRLARDVALKILPERARFDPTRLSRFQREARILASLNHPNIATILGVEDGHGVEAIVLEYVDGITLGDQIARGPLPASEARSIARQIADALDAAHGQGIVHRDLKPDNIKLRSDGTVKVLDFGLAKPIEPFGSAHANVSTITDPGIDLSGALLGTVRYMSPEQARGDAVDRRTDIWAFGCVVYEMLAGRSAFSGERTADVVARILEREPDFTALPTDTPPAVRRLLRRCLEKDVNRRLRDIADARVLLDDDADAEAGADVRPDRAATRRRLPRYVAIGAGLLAVLAGILGVLWQREPADGITGRELLPPFFGTGPAERTPSFAVSPDSRSIVFVATDASGRRALWERTLNDLDARELAGTEGASDPFWKPDSRAVGFFADGMVKTIAIDGGAPKVIAGFPREVTVAGGATAGGTWNQHGQILFAPAPKSRLYLVDESGGEPEPVTAFARGDTGHVRPQFLPDGRHFLYLVTSETADRRGIYVRSLAPSEPRQILQTVVKALYAHPGYLVFVRDGELWARAFDASTQEWTSDDEHQVADSVAHITTEGRASFDVSATGTLVYRESGSGAASQPIVMTLEGDRVATVGPPADYQTLAVSSDGSQLAVEQHDLRTGNGDLWLIAVESGATRQLTFDGIHHNAAIWSPTNDAFVFTGRPGGVRNLHLMDVRSGAHEPLLPSGPDRNPTDWSRNGSYILYEENRPDTNFDLWALKMPERTPIRLSSEPFNERSAVVSKDGRVMAYVSDRSGRAEVYVRPFLDPDAANERQVSVAGGLAPRWSDDGRQLFFYGLDGAVFSVEVGTSPAFSHGRPVQHFAIDMHFACGPANPLRCPAPPVTWEVLSDGRFLINENRTGPASPPLPILVVEPWTARLTGTGR